VSLEYESSETGKLPVGAGPDGAELMGSQAFEELSTELAATEGVEDTLTSNGRLQIITHYTGNKRPGFPLVRAALLNGLPTELAIESEKLIDEKIVRELDDKDINRLVDSIPILPVSLTLDSLKWLILNPPRTYSRTDFHVKVIGGLKLGRLD